MQNGTESGSSNRDDMPNAAWIHRQAASPEDRREYEQERLILWASEAIARAMEELDLTKADLAERLNTSRAHVTQVLSGSRNMTLRTLADLAWACGHRAVVNVEPLRAQEFISHPLHLVQSPKPRLVFAPEPSAVLRSEPAEVDRLAG